jgi:hypothetical protein
MMMKLAKFLPLLALAACTDNATKQESVQIFAAASAAMSSAQTKAVEQAKGQSQLTDPSAVTLDYSGACALGGQVTVKGMYNGEGSDDRAAFDLATTFNGCQEPTGSLDGKIHWTSTASSTGFSATMDGSLDWSSNNGSASCDFDLSLAVTQTSVSYTGHLCGYDVGQLVLGGN